MEEKEYGLPVTFERQKMIDGAYDVSRCFEIQFVNQEDIPDRAFLKEVTFTPNLYLCLNKIYQSFYRIQRRIQSGVQSLEEQIGPDCVNINFIGEPGAGKSFGLRVICAVLGIPMRVESFPGNPVRINFWVFLPLLMGKFNFIGQPFQRFIETAV